MKKECLALAAMDLPLQLHEIYHEVRGPATGPPLVLLHGLGGSSDTFSNILPALSQTFRVIAYDHRGHGRSVQRGQDYSLDVMAGDLGSLLDHLGIESAHLLGTSFGARTGMHFAHLNPGRVRSLLVEDMEMVARVVDYEEEYREKARLSESLPRYFPSFDAVRRALGAFYNPLEVMDAMLSAVQLPDGRVELLHRPHGMFLFDLGGNGVDLTVPLRNFRKPLLFVRADPRNSFLFDEGVRHIRRTRPDVPILTVPGAEHVVHGSHPDRFLDIAGNFYREAEARFSSTPSAD